MAHWTDGYFGALYLDSVGDLLTPALSAAEAGRIAALLRLAPGQRVLDLACGTGRHAGPLAATGAEVVALDRSGDYLRRAREALPAPPAGPWLIRGDQRALPFRSGGFDALFSWYASLFVYDDATNAACLAEAARVVRGGGLLLVHHANPLRLVAEPVASAARTLADGSRVEEESSFDPAHGVDVCRRRLVRPDGGVLAGVARLRYYSPSEWGGLAARTGLRLVEVTSTTGAVSPRREPGAVASLAEGPVPSLVEGPEAPDLIAVLEKPT